MGGEDTTADPWTGSKVIASRRHRLPLSLDRPKIWLADVAICSK
ncbi:hypothetical protein BBAL3_3005 [Brevundimonas sp. BAL3]|nr:hypothetical protein BBAL3_3005 [Brevundimonas sp. BAL3]